MSKETDFEINKDSNGSKLNENSHFELNQESSSEINRIYKVTVPISKFKAWASTQSMSGFRTGNVPLRLLKKDEFLKKELSPVLSEIKKAENIPMIFAANYIIDKFEFNEDIQISLSVEKVPEITHFSDGDKKIDLKNVSFEVNTFKALIQEENVKLGIKNYSEFNAKAGADTNENSKNGDFLTLSIHIEDAKTGHKEDLDQEIRLGAKNILPNIEQALLNQPIGFEYSYDSTEDIKVHFKIKNIKASEALSNEEIIEKLNIKDKSLEEFFKEKLEQEAKTFGDNLILETIKKAIIDTPFEVPVSAIQKEYKKAVDQTLMNLGYIKELKLEKFIKERLGIEVNEFEMTMSNVAAAQAKIRFMYYALATAWNIKIEDVEISQAIQAQIKFFNNNLEQTRKFYDENPDAREEIFENILFNKIAQTLIKKAIKLEPKEVSLDELYKINVQDLEYKIIELNNEQIQQKDAVNNQSETENPSENNK